MGKLVNHTGTTKGPIHLMSKLLMQIGIQVDAKHHWQIGGKMKHISEIEDLKGEIREKAKDSAWKRLAQTRHNYQGMEKGRGEESSEAINRTLKSPLRIDRWQMIQADGIFTPWRAYQRRGTIPNCGYCGNEQCDLEHLLWECQETQLDKTPQFEWSKKERSKAPEQ